MKSISSEFDDPSTLEQLGRASAQVLHDLKNQLNGLKLYATFLKRRLANADRPADEQETIAKLIAGLERAAADMSLLSKFGKTLELKRQIGLNLLRLVRRIEGFDCLQIISPVENLALCLDADPVALGEALRTINSGVTGFRHKDSSDQISVTLSADFSSKPPVAVFNWSGINRRDSSDPFESFLGSEGIRMSFAARVVAEHGGRASVEGDRIVVKLPLIEAAGNASSVE